MRLNILIAGVGGQGTLLASRVLGNYATLKGYDCKLSEVHGMAQRGGSVVTYVKFADKVFSPLVADGDADVLLAFEELEACRYAHIVKKSGKLIVNTQQIMPLPVIAGYAEYPKNISEILKAREVQLYTSEAYKIAEKIGNSRVTNTVMLGILCAVMKFDLVKFKEALLSAVPEKAVQVNLEAFERGYESVL